MLKTRPLLLFLLKAFLIFCILSLPVSVYREMYGKYYRNVCKILFGEFQEAGMAKFTLSKKDAFLHIEIVNLAHADNRGMNLAATADVNTRYRGFIPTIFLLSLLLAYPFPLRRKIFLSIIGFIFMTAFVMLMQWIHIMYMCGQKEWLALYVFSPRVGHLVRFLYINLANYNGSSMALALAFWFFVSLKERESK